MKGCARGRCDGGRTKDVQAVQDAARLCRFPEVWESLV